MFPKIKENLEISEDFNFEISPIVYDKDFNPTRKITFDWCVEIPQNIVIEYGEDKIIEAFSEKLKQDFKNFIKSPK
jgi:hypothetical protein